MKKKGKAESPRREYDLATARPNPYAERANRQIDVVVIEHELEEHQKVNPHGDQT